MLPRAEIAKALSGAIQLAKFDKAGHSAFGHTGEAAKRSFFVAVIVAPMFLLWVATHGIDTAIDVPLPSELTFAFLSYVCGWLIFPILMWHVSEKLGCRAQFFHFLAAYNWAAVIQNGLFMAMDVIFVSIGAPEGARGLFGLILLVYVLLYAWFVAKSALDLPAGPACLVVALDMMASVLWESFTNNMSSSG